MSDNKNDKLKQFVDKNVKDKFDKPINEWSEIVGRIEEEKSKFDWFKKPWVLGSLSGAMATAILVLVTFNSSLFLESPSFVNRDSDLALFLEESQDILDEEEEDDYSYLALIE